MRGLRTAIGADLYRYGGRRDAKAFVRHWLLTPGFRFTVSMRLARACEGAALTRWTLLPWAWLLWQRQRIRFGMDVHYRTEIGPGLYIGHFGTLVVNSAAHIGRDCNLSHDVTIGQLNRGPRAGVPTLGDRVYVGPGARILGAVRIGDDAVIGANAVVVDDVPAGAVVGGIPARVLSHAGSAGYVDHLTGPPPPAAPQTPPR